MAFWYFFCLVFYNARCHCKGWPRFWINPWTRPTQTKLIARKWFGLLLGLMNLNSEITDRTWYTIINLLLIPFSTVGASADHQLKVSIQFLLFLTQSPKQLKGQTKSNLSLLNAMDTNSRILLLLSYVTSCPPSMRILIFYYLTWVLDFNECKRQVVLVWVLNKFCRNLTNPNDMSYLKYSSNIY